MERSSLAALREKFHFPGRGGGSFQRGKEGHIVGVTTPVVVEVFLEELRRGAVFS